MNTFDILTKALPVESRKVEEMLNGVETMKMEDEEQEEVKQPRVTKAQKRRVRQMCHLLIPKEMNLLEHTSV